MKNTLGQRLFLLALMACLATLVFLFARRSVDAQMASELKYQKVNDSVTLTVDGDNIVRIDGEGMLYGEDFNALLEQANLDSKALSDVIVGDGITAIGYGVFDNRSNLKTLKLGSDVGRVSPGGLKRCSSLEYLFMPAGLKDIGMGFLYECEKCRIVTDGEASEFPALPVDVDPAWIYTGVDSLTSLQRACGGGDDLPPALTHWW